MIKVENLKVEKLYLNGKRDVLVDLIADTALEVEAIDSSGATVEGLTENDTMVLGSTCFTAELEFGMLTSTGNWNFE